MNRILFSKRKNVAEDAVDVGLVRHGLNGIVIQSPIGHTIRHRPARVDMFNIASQYHVEESIACVGFQTLFGNLIFMSFAMELVVLVAVTADEVDLMIDAIGVQFLGRTIDCMPRGLIMCVEDGKLVSLLSGSFDDFLHRDGAERSTRSLAGDAN